MAKPLRAACRAGGGAGGEQERSRRGRCRNFLNFPAIGVRDHIFPGGLSHFARSPPAIFTRDSFIFNPSSPARSVFHERGGGVGTEDFYSQLPHFQPLVSCVAYSTSEGGVGAQDFRNFFILISYFNITFRITPKITELSG